MDQIFWDLSALFVVPNKNIDSLGIAEHSRLGGVGRARSTALSPPSGREEAVARALTCSLWRRAWPCGVRGVRGMRGGRGMSSGGGGPGRRFLMFIYRKEVTKCHFDRLIILCW